MGVLDLFRKASSPLSRRFGPARGEEDLFDDEFQRKLDYLALVSRRVNARHPLHALAAQATAGRVPHGYVARRSVFERHGAPLLVTECMLPALWAHLARDIGPAVRVAHTGRERGALDHTASRAHGAPR